MADESKSATSRRLRFHYIKSNFFRVVHMDGALGGLTPRGYIHCAIYNERAAVPLVTEYKLVDDVLSGEEPIEGKVGMVRELEVDLMMSRPVAEELRNWLTDRIKEYDKRLAETEEPQPKKPPRSKTE
jgi:hypothetical protein